jgi:hypothetical protein
MPTYDPTRNVCALLQEFYAKFIQYGETETDTEPEDKFIC